MDLRTKPALTVCSHLVHFASSRKDTLMGPLGSMLVFCMVWVWIIANLSAHGLACLAWHSCNQWYTDKVHYLRIFLELYYVLISQALSVCFLNLYLFGFISVCQQSPTLEYLTLKIKANPNVHKETGTHLRTKKQTIDFNSQTKSQALFESCTCGLHCFPAISCHSIR
jgi:hypothetical protein